MNVNYALQKAQGLLSKYPYLHGWHVEFDKSVARLGMCSFTKKTIFLSKYATSVNTEEVVTNTILHEIAHALAGRRAGHGPLWKATFIGMGGTGTRLGCIAQAAPHKYEVLCNNCHQVVGKYYRRPRITVDHFHNKCKPQIKPQEAQLTLKEVLV